MFYDGCHMFSYGFSTFNRFVNGGPMCSCDCIVCGSMVAYIALQFSYMFLYLSYAFLWLSYVFLGVSYVFPWLSLPNVTCCMR